LSSQLCKRIDNGFIGDDILLALGTDGAEALVDNTPPVDITEGEVDEEYDIGWDDYKDIRRSPLQHRAKQGIDSWPPGDDAIASEPSDPSDITHKPSTEGRCSWRGQIGGNTERHSGNILPNANIQREFNGGQYLQSKPHNHGSGLIRDSNWKQPKAVTRDIQLPDISDFSDWSTSDFMVPADISLTQLAAATEPFLEPTYHSGPLQGTKPILEPGLQKVSNEMDDAWECLAGEDFF
jgi:hypothetical protein